MKFLEDCKKNIFKSVSFLFLGLIGYFVFSKNNVIMQVCFGNKDLPNLSQSQILRWSDPKTWGGKIPQAGAHIVIPSGKTIILDISPPELASLEVVGVLIFGDLDIKLSTQILLLTGVLQVGSPEKKYTHKAEFILKGVDSKFLLQGGRFALFGIKYESDRGPANAVWGFSEYKNITMKKSE